MPQQAAASYTARMTSVFRFLLLTLSLFAAASIVHSQPRDARADPSYRVNAGDELAVSVYGEPELSVNAKVDERGSIAFPLLREIDVKNLTTAEIEEQIIAGLKGPYLVNPKVTVTIKEFRPFFVNGEVQRQGPVPYSPGITVREAITLAGGFTERASKRKIFVIGAGNRNQSKRKRVSLDDVISPGDIITVEQSFF
jgi:polysaccharide biosynthesis/export protein VpsN